MKVEDYETPKLDKGSLLLTLLTPLYILLALMMRHFKYSSWTWFLIGWLTWTFIAELYGFWSNPKRVKDVHWYRPLVSWICFLTEHKWFVNVEFKYIQEALLTCSRCGENEFVKIRQESNQKVNQDES